MMKPEYHPIDEHYRDSDLFTSYHHIISRQVFINTRTWKVSLIWRHSDDGRGVWIVPLTRWHLTRKLAWALWKTTVGRWYAQATYQLAASGILDHEIAARPRWDVWRSFSLEQDAIIARLDQKYGFTKMVNERNHRQWLKANAEDRKQAHTAIR